jgi:restriction endonuclease S subunit
MPIPLPSLGEQQAIAGLLDGVDEAVAEAKRERDGLQLLKESAADALLTGRVRVEPGGHSTWAVNGDRQFKGNCC